MEIEGGLRAWNLVTALGSRGIWEEDRSGRATKQENNRERAPTLSLRVQSWLRTQARTGTMALPSSPDLEDEFIGWKKRTAAFASEARERRTKGEKGLKLEGGSEEFVMHIPAPKRCVSCFFRAREGGRRSGEQVLSRLTLQPNREADGSRQAARSKAKRRESVRAREGGCLSKVRGSMARIEEGGLGCLRASHDSAGGAPTKWEQPQITATQL